MSSARAHSAPRGATHASLRALAGLVAALLVLSSLGQVAHFLLVPHAICLEHGELVELTDTEAHPIHAAAARPAAERGSMAAATTSELSGDHEHCQVLSRGQREQLTPPPALHVLPHPPSPPEPSRVHTGAALPPLGALTLAPKTSPPQAPVG